MKNITKLFCFVLLFLGMSVFSQKITNTPSIVNPFQTKKGTASQNVLAPKTNDTIKRGKLQIENHNGSFYVDLSKEVRIAEDVSKDFNSWFNLNSNHSFVLLASKADDLIFTHNYYQQYYKGEAIEGAILMLHSKNNIVYTSSGQVAQFENIDVTSNITTENALVIAKEHLKVTDLVNLYPVETLIGKIPNDIGFDYKYVHRVIIESSNPFVKVSVYVDATNGSVLNMVSLITNCLSNDNEKVIEKKPFMPFNLDSIKSEDVPLADTPATANTMYSGVQTITTDSHNGGYRLRDNARNIETYNATNATGETPSGYTNAIDYINNSTTWDSYPMLQSVTISSLSQNNWWNPFFIDPIPDLYIKVKNSHNEIVYNGIASSLNNIFPATISSLNIPLIAPPYTIEIWDSDPVGGDDFGGSFIIANTNGSWSVNGNSGSYIISQYAPHLDAHWGAEKSHDFFQDIFGRNGFDANGGIIKQYINIPFEASDNAFASASATINILGYGLGNADYNPFVGLDLVGHEFSHLVVAYRQNLESTLFHINNGLRYQGESGALNESFADIFGTSIEFYTKPSSANWTLFEDFTLPVGNFSRSMSNPKLKNQPDTYDGQFWENPNCGIPTPNNNFCGVHRNSGVQNKWFYLLSQGGNGTNDLNNSYTVTGIGINKARQIAYKNLTTYISSSTSTYINSFIGSLGAAQELYGANSQEYNSVRQAWYAVGIGNDPNNFCSGTTSLTASSGIFTDGSGLSNYGDNSSCSWLITPAGATQILLNFTAFDTEATYDIVTIYNGPDDSYPVLGTYSGNTLPPSISTTSGIGAMLIKFTSDESVTNAGWEASYTSIGITPSCNGITMLTNPTGSFNDGSGSNNYSNNLQCSWYIAPPCATSVTLSFSSFSTELNYDGIVVYDSLDATNQIAIYSGTNLPPSVTSNTGAMLIIFISDFSTSLQGFNANYTSTGSSFCSGTTNLNTSDFGTISDGSGTNNYCNNSNCSWLIQPPNATGITLYFTEFDLEQASSDGNSIYDVVEVYDGTSANAPLIGKFTGSSIPSSVSSSGGSMFIKFTTDFSDTFQGWSAYYTSTQDSYCNTSVTTLTAPSGLFSDGSGIEKYANNSECSWLIQPPNANTVTLSFSSFDTELNYDGVIVFDGINTNAPVLGQFTGSTIPQSVISTGGNMLVLFLSDETVRSNGWNASYNSTTLSINDLELNGGIIIYPNPTFSKIFITSKEYVSSYEIYNSLGQKVIHGSFDKILEQEEIDLTALQSGLYILNLKGEKTNKTFNVIKQ